MYNPNSGEQNLNRFVLISIVLHAILFFTLPNLGSLLESDVPGMASGGVVQVMHIETSTNPKLTPVTNELSQTTVPRVTEPRPIPEVPVVEEPVAQPEVTAEPEPEVEQAKPTIIEEPEEFEIPDPEPLPPVEPEVEEQPLEVGAGEVLTSSTGPEVVVEEVAKEVVTPPEEAKPEPETKPPQTSGSGTGTEGADDSAGESQSGTGTAETAPPAPPPPPSGSSLHVGGGSPLYPKNAEHDGVEGTVLLIVDVLANGELDKIVLGVSSGDERLDVQALRYVEGLWTFKEQNYDYQMEIEVVFSKDENRFITSLNYGDVKWLNAP